MPRIGITALRFILILLRLSIKSTMKLFPRNGKPIGGLDGHLGLIIKRQEADYISYTELIRLFVDIVSKNGNLLLNVGPNPDGTIHPIQTQRLEQLGNWLAIHGEGIYETRPWIRAEGKTRDGNEIRFTQKDDVLYGFAFQNIEQYAGQKLQIIDLSKPKIRSYNFRFSRNNSRYLRK